MGWVAGGDDDTKEDQIPVDRLVIAILEDIKQTDGECTDYVGQAFFCCNKMASCMSKFRNAVTTVQRNEYESQNMHRACRDTNKAIQDTRKCLSDVDCHKSVYVEDILESFDRTVHDTSKTHETHCKDIPPEGTPSTKATTKRELTTTATPTNTTHDLANMSLSTSPIIPTPIVTTIPSPLDSTTSAQTSSKHITSTPTTTRGNTLRDPHIPVSPNLPKTTTTTPIPVSTNSFDSTSGTHTKPPKTGSSKRPDKQGGTTLTDVTATDKRTKTTSTITDVDASTPTIMTDTNSTQSSRNQSITGNSVTSHPENGDTVIIACSVVGGLLLIIAVIVFVFIRWRKYKESQEGSNGSTSSRYPFIWKWLSGSKTIDRTEDTDIYAEIDEAFMEAVYRVDQKKPPKSKSQQIKRQVNICYESGFEDRDAIITGKNTKLQPAHAHAQLSSSNRNHSPTDKGCVEGVLNQHKIVSTGETFSYPLDSIRRTDYSMTSIEGENDGTIQDGDMSKLHKGYILSRPAFTNINYHGDRYDEIASSGGEYVEINEPIYEVPTNEQHTYDSTHIGNFRQNRQIPEQNYNHIHVYKNKDNGTRYDDSDNSDTRFYQNNDSMMEY